MEMDGTPDPEMFRGSYDSLKEFVTQAIKEYPADPKRLFLFGFSMGTMMALALALTSPGLFRGVVANSGYVPEKAGLDLQWSGLSATSFFIAHGTDDPVIPIELGRRTKELFEKSDASWTYREYPMGHEISPEGLTDISDWLRKLI
jgi:phospholipase/carboxylesterase